VKRVVKAVALVALGWQLARLSDWWIETTGVDA